MSFTAIRADTPVVNTAMLRQLFSPTTLEAGRIYALRGRVLELTVDASGGTILARTQGSAADPYAQRITLKPVKYQQLLLSTQCSCPIGRNCKHLAAVLIELQRRQAEPAGEAPAAPHSVHGSGQRESGLPHSIAHWLQQLREAEDAGTEDYPPELRNRLVYVLDFASGASAVPTLRIQPHTVALRRNGSFGAARPYTRHVASAPARYLRPSDRLIMGRLRRSDFADPDDDPVGTLRRILATGRAFWHRLGGQPIREGEPQPCRFAWTLNQDASQCPTIELPEGLLPLLVPDPWYLDPATGQIGPIACEQPIEQVRRLLRAPPIPAELAPQVGRELAGLSRIGFPPPNELPPPERISAPPRPHLRLLDGTLPHDPLEGRGSARQVGDGLFGVALARLSFSYGPVSLPWRPPPKPAPLQLSMLRAAGEPPSWSQPPWPQPPWPQPPQARNPHPPPIIVQNGRLYQATRDERAEAAAADRLATLGFGRISQLAAVGYRHAHSDDFILLEHDAETDWFGLVTRELPKLRAEGWTVEIDDTFPLKMVSPDSSFDAELIEGSGTDWLELHLGVQIDGERVDLVPALLRLLQRPSAAAELEAKPDDASFALPLPDGRLLNMPLARIRPILEVLIELHAGGLVDPRAGKVGFTRHDAAELARFEAASGAVWQGGEALRALGRQLREAGGTIPRSAVPASFHGVLRPYQAQGVDWLQFLRAAELGGILADDMGLGKTVQTLAHLAIEQAAGRLDRPALIVCPTSLVPNWTMEAARFAPTLRLLPLHGPARKSRFDEIANHDLVLTTYPLLARDHAVLTAQPWHAVILDEAQTIKNPNAETTRQALRLKARQRLCLSGTPLQNHLGELWSLFDFLAPGFLGSQAAFRSRFRNPIEKHGDAACGERLSRRVRPFLLRRTKDEVVRELPRKTEIIEPIEMAGGQRAIYESIRLAMHSRVQAAIAEQGLARSGIIILDALLKLRQACCDPRLLKLKATERANAGSAKLERLMEMLGLMLAEGRRVLVFSQFTEMLALIERQVTAAGISYGLLTGDTKDRATPVQRFQAGGLPVFLISLKAGGVGLNLTAADTVIHYDPWWNPAAEDQATDRAHRIGQTKAVFVHRLVTLGTIEEKMERLKAKKRALVAGVLDAEHGGALRLTEADVAALFAPGG